MKIINSNALIALLISAFFAVGCGFGNIKAEESNANTDQIESNKTAVNANELKIKPPMNNVLNVVGTYDYDTEKDGEGYDNSLEITDAGNGKLFVYISGSHIYNVGETQSMHEAEGKGDAILKGDMANATLVDEAGKPCRATIIFKGKTANVKIPDTCQFNIALDGVYQKADSKNKSERNQPENETTDLREISYDKMMDMINDFDAHKVGEEFVITDIPPQILDRQDRADEFGNTSYKNLFYLQGVTADDTPSYSVLTSKAMIESLKQTSGSDSATLRMTAIIAESKGKFDVYRIPFVTKIEGLDEGGKAIWTAIGEKPAKIRFVH